MEALVGQQCPDFSAEVAMSGAKVNFLQLIGNGKPTLLQFYTYVKAPSPRVSLSPRSPSLPIPRESCYL